MKNIWTSCLILTLISLFSGCIARPSSSGMPQNEEKRSSLGFYKLAPLDPLQISFLGIPEEKFLDAIVIDERGTITLPYINDPVTAAGLTTSELERKIRRIYTEKKIYRNITINVATSAKNYYIEGEVRQPKEYPLSRRITLLQAIAAAGGYTEYANKKNVSITRNGKIFNMNVKKIEAHPEKDFPVEAGDRIKIHRTFY